MPSLSCTVVDSTHIKLTGGPTYTKATPAQIDSMGMNLDSLEVCCSLKTGIKEEKAPKATINLYPNPATDHLTLSLNTPQSGTAVITNLLGETLNGFRVSPGNNTIRLAELPPGVYFLTVKTAAGVETRKIIKE